MCINTAIMTFTQPFPNSGMVYGLHTVYSGGIIISLGALMPARLPHPRCAIPIQVGALAVDKLIWGLPGLSKGCLTRRSNSLWLLLTR